jgi:hypothetical protein
MDPITIAVGLSQFVPWVAKMLTGSDRAANVAEQVVNVARAVTGTDSPEAAYDALRADPAKVLEFQQAMATLQADLEKAHLADVQDARALQVAALGQEDRFSKRFVYCFAAAWSIFAMCYFFAVTFIDVPAEGRRVADTILGVLISTVMGSIFGYLYGSTRGGEAKSAMLSVKSTGM